MLYWWHYRPPNAALPTIQSPKAFFFDAFSTADKSTQSA
jgi:hypothetical protein